MEELLRVMDVGFSYITKRDVIEVMKELTFLVHCGEFVSLVGPSGCGKSTLLELICGLLLPQKGYIVFDGKRVTKPSSEIGYMLQRDELFSWRTIENNILLGPEINHKRKEAKTKAYEYLEKYELASFQNAKPSELSGGMRQRAALIRTLMMEPKLLLLDEPFSALDYQTRLKVCSDIWNIIKEQKKTAILVTHDLAEAISTGDRILILSKRPMKLQRELVLADDFRILSPIDRRRDVRFNEYFQQLWEAFEV